MDEKEKFGDFVTVLGKVSEHDRIHYIHAHAVQFAQTLVLQGLNPSDYAVNFYVDEVNVQDDPKFQEIVKIPEGTEIVSIVGWVAKKMPERENNSTLKEGEK